MDTTERIAVALAALLLTHAAALYFRRAPIEQELLGQVQAALRNQGLRDVAVRVEGRDVRLSGTVANAAAARRAVGRVRGIQGVRVVENALRPAS